MRILPLLAVSAAAVLAGGCLGGAHAETRTLDVAATQAFLALGPRVDGVGVEQFSGGLATLLDLDNAANTGHVTATGKLDGHVWKVEFVRFGAEPGAAFEDGGIAVDLDEHGDTGHGSPDLAKVHSDVAGWGSARVTVDGQPRADPVSGAPEWWAHFMVLSTAARDPTTHAVHAGTARPEVHVVLRSAAADPAGGAKLDASEDDLVAPSGYSRDFDVVSNWSLARLHVAASMWGVSSQTGNLTFELRTPAGNALESWQMGGRIAPDQRQEDRRPENITLPVPGKYRLHVSGSGTLAGYHVAASVVPPEPSVYDFWFERVVRGPAAKALESQRAALLG